MIRNNYIVVRKPLAVNTAILTEQGSKSPDNPISLKG
jgi:hypothetical protein